MRIVYVDLGRKPKKDHGFCDGCLKEFSTSKLGFIMYTLDDGEDILAPVCFKCKRYLEK